MSPELAKTRCRLPFNPRASTEPDSMSTVTSPATLTREMSPELPVSFTFAVAPVIRTEPGLDRQRRRSTRRSA